MIIYSQEINRFTYPLEEEYINNLSKALKLQVNIIGFQNYLF